MDIFLDSIIYLTKAIEVMDLTIKNDEQRNVLKRQLFLYAIEILAKQGLLYEEEINHLKVVINNQHK